MTVSLPSTQAKPSCRKLGFSTGSALDPLLPIPVLSGPSSLPAQSLASLDGFISPCPAMGSRWALGSHESLCYFSLSSLIPELRLRGIPNIRANQRLAVASEGKTEFIQKLLH